MPRVRTRFVVAVLLVVSTGLLGAQIPGVPVLQNAFTSPGVVGAVDLVGGSGGSVYAAAASWTPASGRVQLSGGAGTRSHLGSSSFVYGVRMAVPFGSRSSSLGFGVVAGIGGGPNDGRLPNDTLVSTTVIPVGLALGWRRALGGGRGFSVYATPSYLFFSGGTNNTGVARGAIGLDIAVAKAFGVTGGLEFGQTRTPEEGGPTGVLFGFGVSYAIGRR